MRQSHQSSTPSFSRKALRQRILRAALNAPEFRASLTEAATDIRSRAKATATEATIEGAFERILYAHLRDIGLEFHPEKQPAVAAVRHVARGRLDSRLGAVVIEYKRPALLKTSAEHAKASGQLKDYLAALSRQTGAPMVGFLTNGLVVAEVRAVGGVVVSESALEKLTGAMLLRLTEHVVSLALTALTPSNLIRDFCGTETDGVLFRLARALVVALEAPCPKTQMLFSEWEQMFRLAHDDQSQQLRIEERRTALGELFDRRIVSAEEEYRALFALHTAYAIVLKLMAYRTVSDVYLGHAGEDYRSLAGATGSALRAFCGGLEDGEIFRKLNIINLLEGDFFSWYCDRKQWTNATADALRTILETLARYEEAAHVFEANEVPDLFRDLYQAAVPRVVRSSFGEFYTPYWLAEHVLDSASPTGRWRAIDPCCGSGTFVIAAITRLRAECSARRLSAAESLHQVASRIAAIDLNPLSVLTTRINYFIHISGLLGELKQPFVIPVFLGDAAAIPERKVVDGVECLQFELRTLREPIKTTLPVSLVRNTASFVQMMLEYEALIRLQKATEAEALLVGAILGRDRKLGVRLAVKKLTERLVGLERSGWNGIWARILSNFLTTACLGQFTVVFGNPPWIDWKNLPVGYRNRVKDMCVERGLFSGAGRTGGINLNICALISYVSLTNWLDVRGRMAFLMPRELINQASYEGWRRLGGKWRFLELHDWSYAGHPFDPVREDFMTYVIGSGPASKGRVPVQVWRKGAPKGPQTRRMSRSSVGGFDLFATQSVAGQVIPNSTAFTFAEDPEALRALSLVAGECDYVGREGIEFYPQELLLFEYEKPGPKAGTVWVHNVQVAKSKYKIPRQRILLETRYLHPLAKGPELGVCEHTYSGLLVAFPYEASIPKKPIDRDRLRKVSPHLLAHYEKWRDVIDQQTKFSDRIRGADPGEFYGLARTGAYSFAPVYVAYRDNTRWCATVVSDASMPWGERKRFVFQNHAVSMCERRESGTLITPDEAHFVCAILNAPIVRRFVAATSDERSYKIRPPVFVPPFDAGDALHTRLVRLSRQAHSASSGRDALLAECERVYLRLCERRK